MRSLAFVLFVSGIFLLIDAHNHGYFVLRLAYSDRDAIELLRQALVRHCPGDEEIDDQQARLLSGTDTDHDDAHDGDDASEE